MLTVILPVVSYGHGTFSVTLREERRVRVLSKKKRNEDNIWAEAKEVTRDWGKFAVSPCA
jgi:hypothetical protein